MNLSELGWSNWFAERFAVYAGRGLFPGRVVSASRELYRLETELGPAAARPSGRMRRESAGRGDFPVVGDWVAADLAGGAGAVVIYAVLPRRSKFSRKVAGMVTQEQVIAANVDTVFLVNALNSDFNPRRLERYLALARESGADPVVILSKSDLCDCPAQRAAETAAVAGGAPVHLISSVTGAGLDGLKRYLAAGKTVVLLGSSGAGKSTLLNRLAGTERQKVQAVRRGDDRGRHTTSRSELFRLPPGALVIDTPGLRELQLWGSGEGVRETFEDVEFFAARCRFNDCRHREEPGCAVREALQSGELDPERFNSYLKLQRELAFLERRRDYRARQVEQARWKAINKAMRNKKK